MKDHDIAEMVEQYNADLLQGEEPITADEMIEIMSE